jgi:hypothetical protein
MVFQNKLGECEWHDTKLFQEFLVLFYHLINCMYNIASDIYIFKKMTHYCVKNYENEYSK